MAKVKVQITMEEDLLNAVDDYCDTHYMNRSWLITQSLTQVINQQKVLDALVNVSYAVKKCADSGNIDEETKKEIEAFQTMISMILGSK